ncbi:tetratricopeptide repeat protein [uncultured Dokdonia sp.]|uniref:tetratricopeptide repeat protein n=1 Tax=uncultured Dokdonia sp. TaxID=575653 RepID=UPI002620001D|nr:tetratricopeptide repeat protein [uncultured Dokdonia sp.]
MNSVYRCVCALCMLFTLSASVAQESKVDSLKLLLKEIEYPIEKTNLYNEISVSFYNSQLYIDSAYYYNQKAYQIAKEYSLPDKEGRALFNFGLIHTETGETGLAIENYLKALFIFERLKDSRSISVINSSIAALYFTEEKYDKAITFFNKAIEISTRNKDSVGMAIDYANLGETEYKIGKYIAANKHLKLAKNLAKKKGLAFPSLNISCGNTLFALQEADSAIVEGKKGLLLAQQENDIKSISEASDLLYRITYTKENYKEALAHYKRFVMYKDNLNVAKDTNTIEKLKLNAEIQAKEEELSRMQQKEKYLNIIYVLVGIGVILLVFLVSRQVKVVKMAQEVHDIQTKLVGEELNERSIKNE